MARARRGAEGGRGVRRLSVWMLASAALLGGATVALKGAMVAGAVDLELSDLWWSVALGFSAFAAWLLGLAAMVQTRGEDAGLAIVGALALAMVVLVLVLTADVRGSRVVGAIFVGCIALGLAGLVWERWRAGARASSSLLAVAWVGVALPAFALSIGVAPPLEVAVGGGIVGGVAGCVGFLTGRWWVVLADGGAAAE